MCVYIILAIRSSYLSVIVLGISVCSNVWSVIRLICLSVCQLFIHLFVRSVGQSLRPSVAYWFK